jgi:ATP-binding cassette subfamily B protein
MIPTQHVRRSRLRWVARYSFRRRAILALIVALTVLSSLLAALQPIPLMIIVDNALGGEELSPFLQSIAPSGTSALIVWGGVVLVVISLASALLGALLTWLWAVAGTRTIRDLMVDTFDSLQRRSIAFHSRRPVGDSVDRIVTDGWVGYTVMQALLVTPVSQFFTITFVLLAAVRLEAGLTAVMVLAVPLVVVTARWLGERITSRSDVSRAADGAFAGMVHRMVAATPLVRAFAAEPLMRSDYQAHSAATIVAAENTARVQSLAEAVPVTIYACATAAVVVTGAWMVIGGSMTLGVLLVFIAYTSQLSGGVSALLGTHRALKAAESNVERLLEVFESGEVIVEREDPVVLPGPVRGRVCFEDVWFSYEEGLPVLCGVSFGVEPGETVALVGVTGSGKSTLVSLVPRLMDVCGGCVRLDGVDVRDLALRVVRESVSVVRQEPLLLPVSVADNVAFARPGASFEEVWEAARAANALEFIERLPQGFDTVLGERGDTLSGGQKQRLAIARALLKDAPVLILDEPTSALDAGTEHLVVEALQRVTRDRTVMIVTHRESTIVHADRVVRLEHGRVIAGAHR